MPSPFNLIDQRIKAIEEERRKREIEVLKSFERDKMLPGAQNLFRRQGQDLTIMHVPTGYLVKFPAFLDNLNDAYTSRWIEETVFGRMDPIATFSHTERVISLSWNVPADSFEQAEANVGRMNQLISFLYPLYDTDNKGSGATAINQSPLIRLSFGNLIKASNGTGLLGFVNGITFDPALEYGMFNRKKTAGPRTGDPQDNEYYPKTFRLNLEFNVQHENDLGFKLMTKQKKRFQSSAQNKRGERFVFHDDNLNFNNFPYKTTGADVGYRGENYVSFPDPYSPDFDPDALPPLPLTPYEKVQLRQEIFGINPAYQETDRIDPAPRELNPARFGKNWLRPRF